MIQKIKSVFATIIVAFATIGQAQNVIIENEYVRAGVNLSTGTLGSGGATRPGLQYDNTGTHTWPCSSCQGDYLTPGAPFEGYTVRIEDSAGTLIRSYINNNTGTTNITGGVWVGTPDSASAIWAASTADFDITHNYSLPSGQKYININTQINALAAMPKLYFGRYIDPDAMPMAGDTSATDNVLGYGAIPAKNVVFSEATVSRYALGLYTGQTTGNYGAGISPSWSTNPIDYLNNTSGQTVVRGDYTIGLGFMVSGVSIGDIVNFQYAYIFGPNAFSAADSAVTGGAGGGTAGTVPGGGTLVDVGSATSSGGSSSSTPTVTGTAAGTPTVTASSVNGTPTVSTVTTTPVNTRTGLAATVQTVQTVTTITPVTTTTITTPRTVTTYSDGTTTTAADTPVTTVATTNSVSVTATTTTVTEGINSSLPVITASLAHHTASETPTQQTIARETTTNVTTPITKVTTVDVVTDGTTVSSNSNSELLNNVATSVANDSFAGRIDQGAQLSNLNKDLVSSLAVNPFRGDMMATNDGHFFINAGQAGSDMKNGYNASSDTFKIGGDMNVNPDLRVGLTYSKIDTALVGADSKTTQGKEAFGAYGIYKNDKDVIFVSNLNYGQNRINNGRTVGGLFNNAYSTTGNDILVNSRVYAPEIDGSIRPFAGATLIRSETSGYKESGSVQSARTVGGTSSDSGYFEGGILVNKKIDDFALTGEFAINTDNKLTAEAGVTYSPTKDISVGLYGTTQQGVENKTDSWALKGVMRF